ncbi:NPC intracellular cholesterol transporter 2-like [Daphnia pulicaria]|uniref:NPC intracellular cholesterol transporter 2-like n=1 Tax=Daphnia pulicaria TaxID=35523 RepID=UPI001EEA0829|nr:NPC intracellular cholesterol transporter 2-like [Daphnia pulicaria]
MALQMRSITVLVIVLAFYAHADKTLYRVSVHPCFGNNMTAIVLEVRVSDCHTLPCQLTRGSQVTVEFDFIPATNIKSDITTGAAVTIGDISLPDLESKESLACPSITNKQSGLAVGCKLNAKEVYTYSKTTSISDKYPVAENVNIQWELYDDDDKTIVCLNVPAKFVRSK